MSGCGYHFEERGETRTTITVPYIKNDPEGKLTSELIRQLTASGSFEYVREGGALTLNVTIIENKNDKIGYRYDRHEKNGRLTHRLVPTENRKTIAAEITLVEEVSLRELIKPTLVRGAADYDYVGAHSIRDLSFINDKGERQTVSSFSQGQLDSVEGAQDDALIPAYRILAQKIVDGLIQQTW